MCIITIRTCVDPAGHERSFRHVSSGSFPYMNIVGLGITGIKYIPIITDLYTSSTFTCVLQKRLWDHLKIVSRAFDVPISRLIPCRLYVWFMLRVMRTEYNILLKYFLYILVYNVIYMYLNNNECCWCDVTIYVVCV